MKKLTFLCLLVLLSCGQIEDKNLDPNEVSFATTDASKLFFKNTRQLQYDLENLEQAKLEVYRWGEVLNDELPQIHIALVNNWRYDEAYLLLEPNNLIPSFNEMKLKWNISETAENGEIAFVPGNKTEHARFAGQVYVKLRQKAQFEIWINEKWVAVLTEPESRKAFETTVYDFYRLTERL